MDWGFFTKKSLGIDIGVSSIKIAEVSTIGKKKKLENYLEFRFPENVSFRAFDQETLLLLSDEVAEIIQGLFKKTGIKQKKVAFSIPDFSTFFTTFTLPPMTEAEIPQAVQFEARHHIPIPLSEVTFDWKIINKQQGLPGAKLEVLLVAVPNKVLESYQRMATLCQLEVQGMEAEVFGLVRAVIPEEEKEMPICLIDFGWQSTTVSVVEGGNLRSSHSFDISGISLTEALSSELKVSRKEAEELKKEFGLKPERKDVSAVLRSHVSSLAAEIEKICQSFSQTEGDKIEKLILAGGTAFLPGLRDYLSEKLKKQVEEADPFSNFSYPPVLKNRLKTLGPSFAVALGVGLMGAER